MLHRMATSQSRPPTLEQAILTTLADGDEQAAVVLLRRAFGSGGSSDGSDLPELLEELAEYFASVGRPEDAFAVAARAVLLSCSDDDDAELPRCRCRIAEMLLKMGLGDEACAVYTAVAEESPGETWIHEAAGADYLDAGDDELAFAWLTAGLEQAVRDDEKSCIARLLGLRRVTMEALDLPRDELDVHAGALLEARDAHSSEADDLLLLVELDGDGVAPQRALRLLECLRSVNDDRAAVM